MSRIAQLEKLLAADPTDPDVLYMLAQEHAKLGDDVVALAFYDRCLEAKPDYHYAYYHKARTLELSGKPADAAATLRDGLARAKRAGDAKAAGEIESYLLSLGEDP